MKKILKRIYFIYILNNNIKFFYYKIITFYFFFTKKINFISIPRSGTTLLRSAIRQFKSIKKLHIIHDSHFIKSNKYMKYYVISIRDPIDRFISIFYHYKFNQQVGYYPKYLEQFNDIRDFIDTLNDEKTKRFLNSSHHFKESLGTFITKETLIKNPPCFIFLFDDIKNDFIKYASKLDKNINLCKINYFFLTKYGETKSKQIQKNLDLRKSYKLKNYLKNEYHIYNYLFSLRKKINDKFLK